MDDPRYPRLERELQDLRQFPGGVEDSAHGQNVADGYRQGYGDCLANIKDLAWGEHAQSTEQSDFGEQIETHPDLQDHE